MAQTVGNILTRFQTLTQDNDYTRWTRAELIDWLNEAYLRVVTLKPAANPLRTTVTLAAGSTQSLDDTDGVNLPTAISLIRLVRNMGETYKGAIRYIPIIKLELYLPDWYADSESSNIERWSQDNDSPREFVVYPPAVAGTPVEVIVAADPGRHADGELVGGEALKLSDSYAPALLDYVMHRAYSKDDDEPAYQQKSLAHLTAFMAGMGVQPQTESEG